MSLDDKHIDSIFKEAASNISYPKFKEEYFDEILHKLPSKKSNNRKKVFFGFATSILLITSVLFYFSSVIDKNEKLAFEIKKHVELNKEKTKEKSNLLKDVTNLNSINSERISNNYHTKKHTPYSSKKNMEENTIKLDFIDKNLMNFKNSETIELNYNSLKINVSGIQNQLKTEYKSYTPIENKGLFFHSAIGYTQVLKTNEQIIPTALIGLTSRFPSRNIGFEFGINLQAIIANNLQFTDESETYFYKRIAYRQEINYKAIYQLAFPISIYKAYKNSIFHFGVSPQVILGATFKAENFKNGNSYYNERFIMNKFGMSNLSLSTYLGYSCRLTKKSEIGVAVHVNLSNPFSIEISDNLNKYPISSSITYRLKLNNK